MFPAFSSNYVKLLFIKKEKKAVFGKVARKNSTLGNFYSLENFIFDKRSQKFETSFNFQSEIQFDSSFDTVLFFHLRNYSIKFDSSYKPLFDRNLRTNVSKQRGASRQTCHSAPSCGKLCRFAPNLLPFVRKLRHGGSKLVTPFQAAVGASDKITASFDRQPKFGINEIENFELVYNNIKKKLISFNNSFFLASAKKKVFKDNSFASHAPFLQKKKQQRKNLFIIHPSIIWKSRFESSLKTLTVSKMKSEQTLPDRSLRTNVSKQRGASRQTCHSVPSCGKLCRFAPNLLPFVRKLRHGGSNVGGATDSISFFEKKSFETSLNKTIFLFKKVFIVKTFLLFSFSSLNLVCGKLNYRSPFSLTKQRNLKLQPSFEKNTERKFYRSFISSENLRKNLSLRINSLQKIKIFSKQSLEDVREVSYPHVEEPLLCRFAPNRLISFADGFPRGDKVFRKPLSIVFFDSAYSLNAQNTRNKALFEIKKENKSVINNYCRFFNFKLLNLPVFTDGFLNKYSSLKSFSNSLNSRSLRTNASKFFEVKMSKQTLKRLPLLKNTGFHFNKNARFKPKLLILNKANSQESLSTCFVKPYSEFLNSTFVFNSKVKARQNVEKKIQIVFDDRKTFHFISSSTQVLFLSQKATGYLNENFRSQNYKKNTYDLIDKANGFKNLFFDLKGSAAGKPPMQNFLSENQKQIALQQQNTQPAGSLAPRRGTPTLPNGPLLAHIRSQVASQAGGQSLPPLPQLCIPGKVGSEATKSGKLTAKQKGKRIPDLPFNQKESFAKFEQNSIRNQIIFGKNSRFKKLLILNNSNENETLFSKLCPLAPRRGTARQSLPPLPQLCIPGKVWSEATKSAKVTPKQAEKASEKSMHAMQNCGPHACEATCERMGASLERSDKVCFFVPTISPKSFQKKQSVSKFLDFQIQLNLQIQWTFFNSSVSKHEKQQKFLFPLFEETFNLLDVKKSKPLKKTMQKKIYK